MRCFLQKIDGDDTCCVSMTDTQTIMKDCHGDNQEKKFTFDYSLWSFDGFQTREDGYTEKDGPNSIYKDQQYVFDKIGLDVLNNAWSGYHTCLFAYGQTGSGKSHSMIGYGANKGIVPMACQEIFRRIQANDDKDKEF